MKKEWMAIAGLTLFTGLGGVVGCLKDNNPATPQGGQYSIGPQAPTSTFTPSPTPTPMSTTTPTATFVLAFPTATPTPTP